MPVSHSSEGLIGVKHDQNLTFNFDNSLHLFIDFPLTSELGWELVGIAMLFMLVDVRGYVQVELSKVCPPAIEHV